MFYDEPRSRWHRCRVINPLNQQNCNLQEEEEEEECRGISIDPHSLCDVAKICAKLEATLAIRSVTEIAAILWILVETQTSSFPAHTPKPPSSIQRPIPATVCQGTSSFLDSLSDHLPRPRCPVALRAGVPVCLPGRRACGKPDSVSWNP